MYIYKLSWNLKVLLRVEVISKDSRLIRVYLHSPGIIVGK